VASAGIMLGHAVRGKHHLRPVRHFGEILDKHRALGLKPIDHEAVVHDFVAHVDRIGGPIERALDDLDRPIDPGAETRAVRRSAARAEPDCRNRR